ncbi:hypothetical protein QBC40DRAFT_3622 [Triangularia verruculosa]|uniref:Retinol dehydrogenase 13 n=1 Tax=Triangularia verruculosa TaxID=2587418 RepID=A0AAN7AZG3_9PEZI|nr:hypothetical protein QBC40DRAFT_3622 [Triangularia verruculosa]
MPLPFLASLYFEGLPPWFPEPLVALKYTTAAAALALTKWYTSGRLNPSERKLHGRVVILTGGTSGIGAKVAYELASRGAQLCLLTRQPGNDPFLVDYINDLRSRTNNQMIYAEQVDLSSLYSIRQFATKWIDNAPPRRLDMIVLCAATLTTPGHARTETEEGVETEWMVNYLANFHLLGILSPAIKAQPFDRDVRIIIPTCNSYIGAPKLEPELVGDKKGYWSPKMAYARSKLALMVFAKSYQKHLDAYKRPDQLPMNARVVIVDPGFARTVGMRRWLTRGSLWGLFLYMVFYVVAWLLLKSPNMAAQSIMFAAMDGSLLRGTGGKLIKECMEIDCARKDVEDEEVAKKLWEESDKLVEKTEKAAAIKRAREKKEREEREKVEEIESLVETIKKGKAKEGGKKKKAEKAAK